MPTAKKRINLTLDDELYSALNRLSKSKKETLSGTSLKLIERALELEEDLYYSRISDQRLASGEKRIPHKKVWD